MQSPVPDYASAIPHGLEPLAHLEEVLVYPGSGLGKGYEVKTSDKSELYTADFKYKSDGCSCCGTENLKMKSPDGTVVFEGVDSIEEAGICGGGVRQLHVELPPDVKVGQVKRLTIHHYQVSCYGATNTLDIKRESSFLVQSPFQIMAPDKGKIGSIGENKGVKNRLEFPADLEYRYKVLLVATALQIQRQKDSVRRS